MKSLSVKRLKTCLLSGLAILSAQNSWAADIELDIYTAGDATSIVSEFFICPSSNFQIISSDSGNSGRSNLVAVLSSGNSIDISTIEKIKEFNDKSSYLHSEYAKCYKDGSLALVLIGRPEAAIAELGVQEMALQFIIDQDKIEYIIIACVVESEFTVEQEMQAKRYCANFSSGI